MGQLVGVIDGKIDGEAEGVTDATKLGKLDPGLADTRLGWREPVTEGVGDVLACANGADVGNLVGLIFVNKVCAILGHADGIKVGDSDCPDGCPVGCRVD